MEKMSILDKERLVKEINKGCEEIREEWNNQDEKDFIITYYSHYDVIAFALLREVEMPKRIETIDGVEFNIEETISPKEAQEAISFICERVAR